MELALNDTLDWPALAGDFAARGRLQVRDVLTKPSAEHVLSVLEKTPWGLAFNDGNDVAELSLEQCRALTPQQQQEILQRVYRNAAKQYQFFYHYWPLFAEYFKPERKPSPLFAIYEFINSPAFIERIRTLTGRPEIKWADAQATLFRANHFLNCHNDAHSGHRRMAAYVLNFTKEWDKDWGGYLQFFDADNNLDLGLYPTFNALNIFAVPQDHSVGIVAPYAPGSRFAITGWFRGDNPPDPIGAS